VISSFLSFSFCGKGAVGALSASEAKADYREAGRQAAGGSDQERFDGSTARERFAGETR